MPILTQAEERRRETHLETECSTTGNGKNTVEIVPQDAPGLCPSETQKQSQDRKLLLEPSLVSLSTAHF